jgi:hypothetical protein
MDVVSKLNGGLSMTLTRQQKSIAGSLVLLFGALVPAAHATTILPGVLYFTTFQNQGGLGGGALTTNVWSIPFVYDSSAGLCLGTTGPVTTCPAGDPVPTAIKTLSGADGLVFDPNDATFKTLLIGEQSSNKVAQLSTDGSTLTEQLADGTPPPDEGQAYGVAVTPDKTKLLTLPNDAGKSTTFNVNVSPLNPLGVGVPHATSPSTFIKAVAFIGDTAYWGDAVDMTVTGFFGTLDMSNPTFVLSQSSIVDDTGGGAGQGSLPSHGLTYDSFSGCMILSSQDQLWQLCSKPDGAFHIVAKVSTGLACSHPSGNPSCSQVNWDQTAVDGAGHLFAANNDGDLLFIDYSQSATKSISDPSNYSKLQFLAIDLDDIANVIAPQASGCPATKGFWHNHSWPTGSVTVGGVVFSGAPDYTMTIGGITYSHADLLSLLPTGSRSQAGGNGFRIGGSQLIAAILNVANGSSDSASLDATISAMNTELTGHDLRGSKPSNPLNADLISFGSTLDAYNSSAGSLGCTEGAPGD